MRPTKIEFTLFVAAVVATMGLAPHVQAQNEQFIPMLVYRTGPYAPNGIPIANGYIDYLKLLNARDGGLNGVKVTWEECETKYNTKIGVECYEKLKHKGAAGASLINPYSTGITYQLTPKARVDQVPIHSMGYGRTAAADGRIFKWAFNFPTTYWSQASAFIMSASKKAAWRSSRVRPSRSSTTIAPMAKNPSQRSRRWPRSSVMT